MPSPPRAAGGAPGQARGSPPASGAPGGHEQAVSPARACAFAVVRRVFEHGAYADRALHAEGAGLPTRERAQATALAYGTVQRRATLDHVATQLTGRPPGKLHPAVLAALRLGLQQILFMDGVAEHAAVHESVELAKPAGGRGGAGLVNAVLRRATREGRAIVDALDDDTPAAAAVLYSVPVWLAEHWWRELGPDEARVLLAHSNQPAESALRANTLVADPEQVAGALPVAAHRVSELPEAIVLEAPFDVHGSELWRRGAVMAQSRASMLAGRALNPEPEDRVLDLCAAPGAKTTHLAALAGGHAGLLAVERHRGRAEALKRTLARMEVTTARVLVADAAQPRADGELYQAVLVDPPCSGLGTLQSRPDLRWRTSPERIDELSSLQARILRAGAQATAPGGRLVYSVCTISEVECERIVEQFVAEETDFSVEDLSGVWPAAAAGPYLRTLPHRHGTDGFFIARLRRG